MSEPDTHSTVPDSLRWEKSIPNQLLALMGAVRELDQHLEQWGGDARARYLAQLALEELGTNIIKYAYDDQETHMINLRAVCNGRVFRICLEDDGHEFNPCQAPEPDPNLSLEERAPGGWGISLVRRLTEGLQYERRDNRNVVCVTVRRHSESARR
jgi:anti-sigma regulatory factor (Ser/Thr protein kinase)